MSRLICPACRDSALKWLNSIDDNDLLEEGIMECIKCKTQYKGIKGWIDKTPHLKEVKQ
jgi:uncharacterized protein YbaR (Trm112 family)